MKLELVPQTESARREMRRAELDWRNTLKARVVAAKVKQKKVAESPRVRNGFLIALIVTTTLGAVWFHYNG